jgi:integrase
MGRSTFCRSINQTSHCLGTVGSDRPSKIALRISANNFSVKQAIYEGHFDVPKSRRSKRTLPLGPVCAQIFASLRQPDVSPFALVFSTRNASPLSRRNLRNRQLKPACKSLGLKKAKWHSLRHAHATLLDSVGDPLGTVQALLDHASPEVTREIYIGSVPENGRTAFREVE